MIWLPLFSASRTAQVSYVELFDLAIAGEIRACIMHDDYYVDAHALYGWLVDHGRLPSRPVPPSPLWRTRPYVQHRKTAPRPETVAELDRVLGLITGGQG